MIRILDHLYIVSTILFTVVSQLVMRWQVSLAGELPPDIMGKVKFVAQLFLNPWIFVSISCTLLSGISWMLAMSRFEVSYAYPWVALNFILMLMFGVFLFGESFTAIKVLGTLLVIAGIVLIARN